MNKETTIKYNGDTYIVKSQYDYDLYELRLNKDKEIERLNKEIETLKQPQVFIDTQDIEERYAQGIYEDFIEEEYEKLIFDYLTNNCKEFDDEHIKKLVDLKVKQHLSSQKEIERLNNVINEFDKWLLGEKMLFYKSSDGETLIRYGETTNKWLALKEGK